MIQDRMPVPVGTRPEYSSWVFQPRQVFGPVARREAGTGKLVQIRREYCPPGRQNLLPRHRHLHFTPIRESPAPSGGC